MFKKAGFACRLSLGTFESEVVVLNWKKSNSDSRLWVAAPSGGVWSSCDLIQIVGKKWETDGWGEIEAAIFRVEEKAEPKSETVDLSVHLCANPQLYGHELKNEGSAVQLLP